MVATERTFEENGAECEPAIPADAANIVEACAHLAHVVGIYQLNLQHPSRSTVAWFAQDPRAQWSSVMGMDYTPPRPFRALYFKSHGVSVCMLVDQSMAHELGAPAIDRKEIGGCSCGAKFYNRAAAIEHYEQCHLEAP